MRENIACMARSDLFRQSWRFALVGIIATVLNYAVNQLLIIWGRGPELASAVGYISGILIGFPLNKLWAFEAKGSGNSKHEITRYFIVYLITFIINSILAGFSFRMFNLLFDFNTWPMLKAVYYFPVIAITTVLNFIGCKWVVFRGKNA